MAGALGQGGSLLRLRSGDVHVWTLWLDLAPATRDRLAALLSAGERARAQRFARATDHDRYVSAHGLLRLVLSGYVEAPPQDIALEDRSGGKPHLVDRAGPRFSLSHADGLGLVAVSPDCEVGIDVERIRDVGNVGDLARSCFSPAEQAALAVVAASQRLGAFLAGWTRKEAFLKAVGDGLWRPLDSFAVSLTPGQPARLLHVDGAPGAPRRYSLRALHPAPGYVAALAADRLGVAIRWRPWAVLAAQAEALVRAGGPGRDSGQRAGVGHGAARDGYARSGRARGAWHSHVVPIVEREP
jgi:4'-phosphopantetheinyl transferase